MLCKIMAVLSFVLYVQGETEAISEQKVVMNYQTSRHSGSMMHEEPNKSDQEKHARTYSSYEFSYKVNDPETHDIKGQQEKGNEDEVIGNYWLIEPNGRKRTVNYQANDHHGFNAQIDYTTFTKEKETDDVSDTMPSREQVKVEKENDESIKSTLDELVQSAQDTENTSGESSEQPTLEESDLNDENELETQVNEATNIERIVHKNIDRGTERIHVNPDFVSNKRENDNRNLNKSRRGNRASNNPEKDKRENVKRNKNRISSHTGNESSGNYRDEQRSGKRIKQEEQENVKMLNENNSRIAIKKLNVNRHKNLHTTENRGIDASKNKNQVNSNVRKEENNHNIIQNNFGNDTNFVVSNLAPSESDIQREIAHSNIANNRETYAHSIRIYHPKNISPTIKEQP